MWEKYILLIVDDSSRYAWVVFLSYKSDAFGVFKSLAKRITIKKNDPIMAIRSDRGREFINENFVDFCEKDHSTKWNTRVKEAVTYGNGYNSLQRPRLASQILG